MKTRTTLDDLNKTFELILEAAEDLKKASDKMDIALNQRKMIEQAARFSELAKAYEGDKAGFILNIDNADFCKEFGITPRQ